MKKVFSVVAVPFALGAGKSDTDHRSDITGFYYSPDYDELLNIAQASLPSLRRLGTIHLTGDLETEILMQRLRESAARHRIEIESVGFSSSSEIADAAKGLIAASPMPSCSIPIPTRAR